MLLFYHLTALVQDAVIGDQCIDNIESSEASKISTADLAAIHTQNNLTRGVEKRLKGFTAYLFNGVVVSLVSTALSLVLGIPAAYAMVFQMRNRSSNTVVHHFCLERFLLRRHTDLYELANAAHYGCGIYE